MRNNPLSGALFLLRGLHLIMRPRVRRFVVLPLAINIVVFAVLIWLSADQFQRLIDYLVPEALDFARYLLWPLFALAIMVFAFYTFALIGNFVAAPFNGMLADAVERELTGRAIEGEGGLRSIAKDVAGALASELQKLGYILTRMVPLALLFLVPVVNLAMPFVWMAFSAWMLAVSFADFPMGNHGLRFRDQRARLARQRFLSLGFGGAVMFGITIPLVNFIMIPAAVAGATAMWVEEFRDA